MSQDITEVDMKCYIYAIFLNLVGGMNLSDVGWDGVNDNLTTWISYD